MPVGVLLNLGNGTFVVFRTINQTLYITLWEINRYWCLSGWWCSNKENWRSMADQRNYWKIQVQCSLTWQNMRPGWSRLLQPARRKNAQHPAALAQAQKTVWILDLMDLNRPRGVTVGQKWDSIRPVWSKNNTVLRLSSVLRTLFLSPWWKSTVLSLVLTKTAKMNVLLVCTGCHLWGKDQWGRVLSLPP